MGRFLPSLVVLLLLPMVACAEIYSFRDRNGVINLSDRPPQSGSFRTLSRNQSGEWGIQQVHRNLVGRGGYSIRHQLDRYQIHPDGIGVTADRDGRYRQSVASSASRHGVDHRLLDAVIAVESSYDRWAVSSAGAQGLMQLMPATAVELGVSDPFDPQQNIDGGARHLRRLLDQFGRLDLALAAYNAGESAVIRAGNQIPPYPETQRYVRKVLEAYTAP